MKHIMILVLLFCINSLLASEQIPDLLLYDGKELTLDIYPLESYFEKYPEKKSNHNIMSTALRRGYIATFEFKDNFLTLNKLIIPDWSQKERIERSVIDTVFPDVKDRQLRWYNGLLVIPIGEKNISFADESYFLFHIVEGKLMAIKKYNLNEYKKFKRRMFERYTKTEDYKKQYNTLNKKIKNQFNPDDLLYSTGDFYQHVKIDFN
ncbi:MAG: hypothetical protein V4732_21830 [Pseudomonadota bacterium]